MSCFPDFCTGLDLHLESLLVDWFCMLVSRFEIRGLGFCYLVSFEAVIGSGCCSYCWFGSGEDDFSRCCEVVESVDECLD